MWAVRARHGVERHLGELRVSWAQSNAWTEAAASFWKLGQLLCEPERVALDRGHPGVALLAAEDALGRDLPALALEQVRCALRRSALSPALLGLYAAALQATGRCSEAAMVARNASALFASDCSLRNLDTNERLGCAEYVQSRVGAPASGDPR